MSCSVSDFFFFAVFVLPGKTILRLIDVTNPTKDLSTILRSSKVSTIASLNVVVFIIFSFQFFFLNLLFFNVVLYILLQAGADDMKLVAGLTDMLEKGLNLDPARRLNVVDAFKHPFFASK